MNQTYMCPSENLSTGLNWSEIELIYLETEKMNLKKGPKSKFPIPSLCNGTCSYKNNTDSTTLPHLFPPCQYYRNVKIYACSTEIVLKVAILHNLFVFPWANDAFYAFSPLFMAEKNLCIVWSKGETRYIKQLSRLQ